MSNGSQRQRACTRVWIGLAAIFSAGPLSWAATEPMQETEEAAAARYITHIEELLRTRVVPSLRQAMLGLATTRPPSLTVEVMADPSSYRIGAKIEPDGALKVRLSTGYLAMHDAALDAVAIADALDRPRDLRPYLMYQLRLAHDNERRRARGEIAQRAQTFAQFTRLDPTLAMQLMAQARWRSARNRVEADSLGWTIAHLLARADSRLAGLTDPAAAREGLGAARLAAGAGRFPVPPVATAFGIAAMERSAAVSFDERAVLCRAARLMAGGVATLRTSASWRAQLQQDARVRERLASIEFQIARMRRDGHCVPRRPVPARRPPVSARNDFALFSFGSIHISSPRSLT